METECVSYCASLGPSTALATLVPLRGPGLIPATSIIATVSQTDRSFQLVARGCRPFSTENDPLDRFPGVPNPRTDEISSTGGHRFFAPFSAENDLNRARTADLWSRAPRTGGSLARFPGVPNPRMTTGAYVCGRENNSACRKNDKQYKNGRPDGRPFYTGLRDQGLAG